MIRLFTPDREAPPSKKSLVFIRSESKSGTVWQYLKRYENPKFVSDCLKQQYPGVDASLRKTKASHIADCIRQAESYFNTANTSELSIKPLILYYGMLNLVKALIIFGDNGITLDDDVMKQEGLNTHGLTHGTKDNVDITIRNNQKKLLEEFCYTSSRGSNESVFRLVHQCWSNKKIPSGVRFTVGDIASMHPSSWQSYSNYTGKPAKYFPADSAFRTTANGYEHFLLFKGTFQFLNYQNKTTPGKGNEFFEKHIPRLKKLYDRDTGNSPYGYSSKKPPSSIDSYQPTYRATTGASYTMLDSSSGFPMHPIEIEFVMMFILGSLTRYSPQKWLGNVLYQGGDSMFVIEGFINSVSLSFPKMILEEFDLQDYTFTGDSAYYG